MSINSKNLKAAQDGVKEAENKLLKALDYKEKTEAKIESLKADIRTAVTEGNDTGTLSADVSAATVELEETQKAIDSLRTTLRIAKDRLKKEKAQGLADAALELVTSELIPEVLETVKKLASYQQAEVCRTIGAPVEDAELYENPELNHTKILRKGQIGTVAHVAAALVQMAEKKRSFCID